MFKFNFNEEKNDEDEVLTSLNGDPDKCKEHGQDFDKCLLDSLQVFEMEGLQYVNSAQVLQQMKDKPDFLNQQSDLVKNVYEGNYQKYQ